MSGDAICRSELLQLSGWSEEYIEDVIKTKVITGLRSLTTVQYVLLYEAIQQSGNPIYPTLEEILRFTNSFSIPAKLSNVTRKVYKNIRRNENLKECVIKTSEEKQGDCIASSCEIGKKPLTVGGFHELFVFLRKNGYSLLKIQKYLENLLPNIEISVDRIRYLHKKIATIMQKLRKNKDEELETFKNISFLQYSSTTDKKQAILEDRVEEKNLKIEITKMKQAYEEIHKNMKEVTVQNDTLREIICDNNDRQEKLESSLSQKKFIIEKMNTLNISNKHLKENSINLEKKLKTLKKENFIKRLQRKKKLLDARERKLNPREPKLKTKMKELKAKVSGLEKKISGMKEEHHTKSRKYINRLAYANFVKKQSLDMMHHQRVETESMKQENLALKRELCNLNELTRENEVVETKIDNRYNDDLRTCVMELHGMDISTNKISGVIKTVSDVVFHTDVQVPSRTTVQNICDEGHVVAKHHVSELLSNSKHFDIFSDGTCRDGKKIINAGAHTSNSTVVLGFQPVAREDSQTVANIIKNYITETADLNNSPVTSLLSSLSGMMSDRSSVMKKANIILDEWRTSQLKDIHDESDIVKLNFFYCTAHVLLGFHNEILKDLKTMQKVPIGRDLIVQFSNFKNSTEPPSVRLIRTASEVLGPRGDEKNGARQQWLAYVCLKSKSSKIISYRGNRFNNLFTGAVAVLHHRSDIIDFLTNHIESPNLKLQSVLADISSKDVISQVAALAVVSIRIAEPFWSLINSNEHYLDLYKFIGPLHDLLAVCVDKPDGLLLHDMAPLFVKFPHIVDSSLINASKSLPGILENLKGICHSMMKVVKRQLKDHLPSGLFSEEPDVTFRGQTMHTKLTNIPSENLFGDLDSSMRRKPNATLRHHSSVTMFKRNHTAVWLKKKSNASRKCLLMVARKKAKSLKRKEQICEKYVMEQRKEMIKETKKRKLRLKQKQKLEIKQIENNVRKMGGIVRNREDVDNILDQCRTARLKKEKLRNQLLYCKHIKHISIPSSRYAWKITVTQMKENLVDILSLDDYKTIDRGTWVAVSYEDTWYPGEVVSVLEKNKYRVKFLSRRNKDASTFVWPHVDDIGDVEKKFIIFSNFDILPSPGLRFWIVPDFEEISSKHKCFVEKYF